MSEDAQNWQRVTEKLRRAMGLSPPTPEQADEAMRSACEAPITSDQIDAIVRGVVNDKPPRQTLEEDVSWFDEIDTEELVEDTRLVMNRNAGDEDDGGEEVDDEIARKTEEALNDDDEEEDNQA